MNIHPSRLAAVALAFAVGFAAVIALAPAKTSPAGMASAGPRVWTDPVRTSPALPGGTRRSVQATALPSD